MRAWLISSISLSIGCGFHGGASAVDGAVAVDDTGRPIDAIQLPIDVPAVVPQTFVLEAEAPTSSTAGFDGTHTFLWTFANTATESTITGYSGTGFMHLLPGDGFTCDQTAAATCGIINYSVTITVPATYYLHLRLDATSNANDSVFSGFDGVVSSTQIAVASDGAWHWSAPVAVQLAAGPHVISVWQREAGVRLDLVVLSPTMADPALP